MRDEIYATLERAAHDGKPVALFTSETNPERFSVGFVDRVSKTQVRLRSLSPDGEDDGYEVRDLAGVHRVEVDGAYERRMALLAAHRGEIFREIALNGAGENGDLIASTLREAKARQLPVRLWTAEDEYGVGGFVQALTKSAVTLQAITDAGEDGGVVTLSLHAVADMDVNSRGLQKAVFLYRRAEGR